MKPVLVKATLGKFCIIGQTVYQMDEGDPGFGYTKDIILKNESGRLIGLDQAKFDQHFTYDFSQAPPPYEPPKPSDNPDDDSGIPGANVGDDDDNTPVLEEEPEGDPNEL